jgi:hypothetical protein
MGYLAGMTSGEQNDPGTTKPAGEDVSDDEFAAQVAHQTDPNLLAEDVFEREADGSSADGPAEALDADDLT